jgi:hypothetical protein
MSLSARQERLLDSPTAPHRAENRPFCVLVHDALRSMFHLRDSGAKAVPGGDRSVQARRTKDVRVHSPRAGHRP